MTARIVARHATKAGLYRHLSQVMHARATEQLRGGRNPEQAAMLAAEYGQLATRSASRQGALLAADATNTVHAGER